MRRRDMRRLSPSSPLFCKVWLLIPCPHSFHVWFSFSSLFVRSVITFFLFTFLFYLFFSRHETLYSWENLGSKFSLPCIIFFVFSFVFRFFLPQIQCPSVPSLPPLCSHPLSVLGRVSALFFLQSVFLLYFLPPFFYILFVFFGLHFLLFLFCNMWLLNANPPFPSLMFPVSSPSFLFFSSMILHAISWGLSSRGRLEPLSWTNTTYVLIY